MGIDYDKLSKKLEEIKNRPQRPPPSPCPLRGLTGELRRKQNAEMAGCMHAGMTVEDHEEILRIQWEYDKKQFNEETRQRRLNKD